MDKYEAQRLGTNADAQSVLKNEVSVFFPQLEAGQEISDEIVGQFYDWQFPFTYTQDGGGARRWRASVRAVCRKNKKLQQLEELFESSGTDGTLKEVYSGQDEDEYTDNHATRTKTEFSGVGTTTSENLGDTTTNEPVDGKNTTTTVRKKGTTRTYADGRTWTQILKDVGAAVDPVDEFINAFAQVLLPPCEEPCCMLPPSVSMAVEANELPTGTPPTAEIVNRGSSLAADWLLSLGLPLGVRGLKGDTGDTGAPALTYDNVYYSSAPVVVGLRIIQESAKFNRAAEIGDPCIIVCADTTTTPFKPYLTVCNVVRSDTGDGFVWLDVVNAVDAQGTQGVQGESGEAATIEIGTVTTGAAGTPAKVENVGTDNAAVLNFTIPQGEKGDAGEGTKKMYLHSLTMSVEVAFTIYRNGGVPVSVQSVTYNVQVSAITSSPTPYTAYFGIPQNVPFVGVQRLIIESGAEAFAVQSTWTRRGTSSYLSAVGRAISASDRTFIVGAFSTTSIGTGKVSDNVTEI